MSKPADPKLIGAFVLGAIVLIIGGLIVLGGGKFFQRTTPVVMYFQGSVAGLSAGSPVNFRGVRVGQVTNVSIRYQPNGGDPLIIPVFAELISDNVQLVATRDQKKESRPGKGVVLRKLIDDGLRAQLAIPSLVTGQATVSLDLIPGSPAQFLDTYPGWIEIPTVPSTLQEVQATLQQIYEKLSKLPLDELIEDTRTFIKGANRLVNDPAITQAVADASQAMTDLLAGNPHSGQPHPPSDRQSRYGLDQRRPDIEIRSAGDHRYRRSLETNVSGNGCNVAGRPTGAGASRPYSEDREQRHATRRTGQLRPDQCAE